MVRKTDCDMTGCSASDDARAPKGLRRCISRIAWALLGLVTGGCGGAKLTHIKDLEDFRQQVLASEKPVLMYFYKGGCPTCGLIEPTLDQLADEYSGRVTCASFELMTPYFAVTAPEIRKEHRIAWFPTVLLFINGKEEKRWVMKYGIDDYRSALDETLGPAPMPAEGVGLSSPS